MYPIINDPQNYSAALYLRLSKEDDNKKGVNDDSESIKNQRALLEGYAKEQKLTVYDVYIDDGFSGTSNKRPDFERMLDDISNHNVNMVITIIQLKIDKAFDNKLSGLVDDDDFQRVYTSLKQEQKDLRNKIQALENSTNEDIILDIQRTKELVEAFLNAEEYSRDLIVSLIKRVELTANKELHIHFRFKELELTSHL